MFRYIFILFLGYSTYSQEYKLKKRESIILRNGDTSNFSMYFHDNVEDLQRGRSYNYLKNKKICYLVDEKVVKYKDFDLQDEILRSNIKKLRKCTDKDSIFVITNNSDYEYLIIIETNNK